MTARTRPASTDIPAATLTSFTRPARARAARSPSSSPRRRPRPGAPPPRRPADEHADDAAGHRAAIDPRRGRERRPRAAALRPAVDRHRPSVREADQELTRTGPGDCAKSATSSTACAAPLSRPPSTSSGGPTRSRDASTSHVRAAATVPAMTTRNARRPVDGLDRDRSRVRP